jgi:hypothetical protein
MFEEYINRTAQNLMDNLEVGNQFIYLREIMENQEIKQFYKDYFVAEVKWWLYEEQMHRHNNPFFELDSSEMGALFEDLDKHYFNNARFDVDSLKKITLQSVRTHINLLCRPRTTLKWFIFRGEPTKLYKEISLRLNYLNEYNYLSSVFKKWIDNKINDDKDNHIISLIEFERTIENIDNEAIFDISPKQFIEMLTPLYSFFNVDNEPEDNFEIPIEAIIVFLDDKGIFKISEKFQKCLEDNNLLMVNKVKVLDIIYEVIEEVENEFPEQSVSNVISNDNITADIGVNKNFENLPDNISYIRQYSGNVNKYDETEKFEVSDELGSIYFYESQNIK